MTVIYNGRKFKFRPCDVQHLTQEELQEKASKTGYMQYDPNASWLVVRGAGYGWLVD